MKTIITILILFCSVAAAQAQTLLGTTGWLNIPTADMQEDGTFYAGGSFIDKSYIEDDVLGQYNVLTYYFDLTFLPFLEISFGNTRLLDNTEDNNTVDRRFSFRIRPLRERKYVPAIVIGAHDIYTSISNKEITNQYFSSLYIVATKHIPVKKSEFGLTLGYGFAPSRVNQFVGLFGGLSFSPGFYRPMNFIAEYDGKSINIGLNTMLVKHLFLYAMLHDFSDFSGGLAYHVFLLNKAK
jgi:hypothetical protein